MISKGFSPATFVNEFKKETGLNDVPDFEDKDAARSFLEDAIRDGDRDKKSRYQDVLSAQGFAIAIGDQSKLTQCLKGCHRRATPNDHRRPKTIYSRWLSKVHTHY